jgi:hypothetical protein
MSCSGKKSLEDYIEENDGSNQYLSNREIAELAETAGVDEDDYGIEDIVKIKNKSGKYAFIIECSSEKNAEQLEEDIEDYVYLLDVYYDYGLSTEREGKFVFAGVESVINNVLD